MVIALSLSLSLTNFKNLYKLIYGVSNHGWEQKTVFKEELSDTITRLFLKYPICRNVVTSCQVTAACKDSILLKPDMAYRIPP
jgi:hypothetical protein